MDASAPVKLGDVLAGKYQVERVLGQGGMGVVVAARHVQLTERVALKFLLPEVAQQGEVVARFLREAQATARIRSEHVARVTDMGQLDNGSPYLVMEYLEGTDLAHRVRQGGPLPLGDAVDYVLQACEALAEAHSLGIVHRDIKPSNLFLTHRADGSALVKVLDFGIAKATSPDGSAMAAAALTRTSTVVGSPYYMAPEQMRSSKSVDHRADIWSLGVVLYELLSGAPPFRGDTMPELCARILMDPPPPLAAVRADIPAAFVAVLDRMLAKELSARFSSVGECAAALAAFSTPAGRVSAERASRISLDGEAIRSGSLPSLPSVSVPDLRAATANSFALSAAQPAPPRRGLWIGVGAAALVAVGALGMAVGRGSQAEPQAAQAAAASSAPSEAPAAPPEPAPASAAPSASAAPAASATAPRPAKGAGAPARVPSGVYGNRK